MTSSSKRLTRGGICGRDLAKGYVMSQASALDEFERLRPRLFGIAYRMTGAAGEAEDLVQDAWLRWQGTDHDVVRNAEAFLVTTVTRLSGASVRRWLSARTSAGFPPASAGPGGGAVCARHTRTAATAMTAAMIRIEILVMRCDMKTSY